MSIIIMTDEDLLSDLWWLTNGMTVSEPINHQVLSQDPTFVVLSLWLHTPAALSALGCVV